MFSLNILKDIYEKHENRDFHPTAARCSEIDVSHEIHEKTDASKEAVKECWFSPYASRLEPNRFSRWLTERASPQLLGRPSGMRRAAGRDLGRVQFHLRAFCVPNLARPAP